jgi:hypothetical protein
VEQKRLIGNTTVADVLDALVALSGVEATTTGCPGRNGAAMPATASCRRTPAARSNGSTAMRSGVEGCSCA